MVKAKARYGYKGIVVDDCPFCHRTHRHNHSVGEGVRMAECFGGEYLLDFEAAEQKMHLTLGESPASDSESTPAPKQVI